MCHVEVECLGAVVVAGPERDGEAHLAQRNGGSIGDTSERPCRCQPFVGDLQLLKCLHRDHVEARTPVKDCLGDDDVVDGGGARKATMIVVTRTFSMRLVRRYIFESHL